MITNSKVKTRKNLQSEKRIPNTYLKKNQTSGNIPNVRFQILKENPPTHRTIAKSLYFFKVINSDLNL